MTPLQQGNLVFLGAALAGIVLVSVVLHLVERGTSRYVAHRFGWRAVLATGWLGVPLHELGHLVVARLFGHRIVAWRLFDPDPVTGTLGYVRHACSRDSLWQRLGNFPIAVAPLATGAAALIGLLWWMLPTDALLGVLERTTDLDRVDLGEPGALLIELKSFAAHLAAAIWEHKSPILPLQLYLAVCVACHLAPSAADLASAIPGLVLAAVLLAAAAIGAGAMEVSLAAGLAVLPPLVALATAAVLFQGLFVAAVALAGRLERARSRRRAWSSR